jgi:hypothetical protein
VYGMGDDLSSQVQALTDAGVDPSVAYQTVVSSMGTSNAVPINPATGMPYPLSASSSAASLSTPTMIGGLSLTTWLIGGAALVAALAVFSGGRRW